MLATGAEGRAVSCAEALRAAQEVVRKEPGREHPFHWGAWSVWGLP